MSSPARSSRENVGSMPWNEFGPANVPLAAQCTATWSPSATMSCTSKRKSGVAPKNSAQ